VQGGFSLTQILEWSQAKWVNSAALGSPSPESIRVERPGRLGNAGPTEIAFFFSQAYQQELLTSQAGILLVGEAFIVPLEAAGLALWKKSAVICARDPYLALAVLSEKFAAGVSDGAHLTPVQGGVHPSAIIDLSAEVHPDAQVGAHCVIEAGAKIGARAVLYPGVYVGHRVAVGEESVLFSGVKLYEDTVIGSRVRIHANAVIGADGFGYALQTKDGKPVRHQKIYHFGNVVIEDDVEIGAVTCIDRATFGSTRVGKGAKIDNQVMVGHNCQIDEGAVLCGKVGMSGTSSVGKFAYLGGGAGLHNQVHIGDGAKVGGMSLVIGDVRPGMTVMGQPAREQKKFLRIQALLSRMLEDREKARKAKGGSHE
jgi:UDP-3-O-[3-hydroxymyristoyl] glucosamine N-acyltransferase